MIRMIRHYEFTRAGTSGPYRCTACNYEVPDSIYPRTVLRLKQAHAALYRKPYESRGTIA